MQITIRQQPLSIGDQFEITIDNQSSYRASTRLFRWMHTIVIKPENGEETLVTITQEFNWLRPRDRIERQNEVLVFNIQDFWRSQYRCEVGRDDHGQVDGGTMMNDIF